MNALVRPISLLQLPAGLRPSIAARLYATQTGLGTTSSASQQKRKTVTPFNDDGRVPWGQLSGKEKVARTTQQSFNFTFIILGAVLTGGVAYVMYTEVFSLDSKTAHFNRSFDQLRKDSRCTDLLGDSKKITAYGEPTFNKWRRARPIASTVQIDKYGTEHLIMHYNVEGPSNSGIVNLHMTKSRSAAEFTYKYLFLDVKGKQRIYLENSDGRPSSSGNSKMKLFGWLNAECFFHMARYLEEFLIEHHHIPQSLTPWEVWSVIRVITKQSRLAGTFHGAMAPKLERVVRAGESVPQWFEQLVSIRGGEQVTASLLSPSRSSFNVVEHMIKVLVPGDFSNIE